jgi:hypothetical protein
MHFSDITHGSRASVAPTLTHRQPRGPQNPTIQCWLSGGPNSAPPRLNDSAAGTTETGALTTDAHEWARTGWEIPIEPFWKNGGKIQVKLVRFEILPRESVPILVIRGHPPSLQFSPRIPRISRIAGKTSVVSVSSVVERGEVQGPRFKVRSARAILHPLPSILASRPAVDPCFWEPEWKRGSPPAKRAKAAKREPQAGEMSPSMQDFPDFHHGVYGFHRSTGRHPWYPCHPWLKSGRQDFHHRFHGFHRWPTRRPRNPWLNAVKFKVQGSPARCAAAPGCGRDRHSITPPLRHSATSSSILLSLTP